MTDVHHHFRKISTVIFIFMVIGSGASPAVATLNPAEESLEAETEYRGSDPNGNTAKLEATNNQQSTNDSVQVVEGKTDRVDNDGRVRSEENQDGDDVFGSIQVAINNAEEGDTVRVLPGTYRERVKLRKNITLVAPRGATLNGSTFEIKSGGASGPFGIHIGRNASPTIDGFTITRYADAILDYRGSGDWTVTNVTVLDTTDDGIGAQFTTGDWTIKNTVIDNTSRLGVHAGRGNWTIENTTIRNVPQVGIDKTEKSGGNWTVSNTTIKNVGAVGIRVYPGNLTVENSRIINTSYAGISSNRFATYRGEVDGTWTVKNTTIRDSRFGIFDAQTSIDWRVTNSRISGVSETGINAVNSSGKWTVRETTIRGSGESSVRLSRSQGQWTIEGSRIVENSRGIVAKQTTGQLSIQNTSFVENNRFAVNAQNAERPVKATQNWWGTTDGPRSEDCLGAVNCEDWLRAPPNGSAQNQSTDTEVSSNTLTATPPVTEANTTSETHNTTRPRTEEERAVTSTTSPGLGVPATILALFIVHILTTRHYA